MTRRSASECKIARVTFEVDQAIGAQPRTHDNTHVVTPGGRIAIAGHKQESCASA